jgi:cellulose synthase/poly-beta-1,6-N-acetylglucosamine synthase-like glycosyltransferase
LKIILSIIIPSYKDQYLPKTIDSLIENAEGEIEVVVVLDAYWPTTPLRTDIKVVHLGRNRGMRGAINAGVAVSRGEFIMRVDEHQLFGKGYDRILTETCQPNWIVTPRRFALDPVGWKIMDIPPVDYMDLKIVNVGEGVRKFSGVEKPGNDEMIQESMAMQGSCWVMPRQWWNDVIGELQTEGYGPHIQDSHEMVFKTWRAGGKLMVNKNTYHAHKHRSFPRTHNNGTPENPANCNAGYKYALDQWEDYYNEIINGKSKEMSNS